MTSMPETPAATGTTSSGGPLQQRPFTTRPTIIPQLGPDGRWNGNIVKVELVLLRGLDGGAREHLWIGPDPRLHNHPWTYIDCKILRGQYTALECVPDGNGGFTDREVTLCAGDPEYRVLHETYHQIVQVEPGTISVMSFGPVIGDGKQWGHLAKGEDGIYRHDPAVNTANEFVNALRHCNPHMRPDGWEDPYADLPVPDLNELMASVGL
jgi:hypothetical protein